MSFLSLFQEEVRILSEKFAISEDKAFAAWAAKVILELDDQDAFDALSVEGPNDKGMDLFWIDQQNRRVFIAQCKYSKSATTNPKEKDLVKLLSCIDWISNPVALQKEGRPELVAAAEEYKKALEDGYITELWFIYCGSRDENIDKRIRIHNSNPENRDHSRTAVHCDFNLLEVYFEEARGEGRRVEKGAVQIGDYFEESGLFGKGLVTSLLAEELISLYKRHGDHLFARNVRTWLGARRGSVNAGIITTVEDENEKGNFWAYNNGITFVCDSYELEEEKRLLTLGNFSIVNGCQTTVALAQSDTIPDETVSLVARFIMPREQTINSIIQYTNTQNPIRSWDLVSQHPTQRRLKSEFERLNKPVYYAIRRGDWASLSKTERREFKVSDSRAYRTIKHDLLAQFLASYRGMAVTAYKDKAFLFDRYYERTFPSDMRVEEALFVWRVGQSVVDLVTDEIRKESENVRAGDREREKYLLMLKRGGRFFVVGVVGLIAALRNGPDYLRSLDEERITSKGATDRIDKYTQLSVSLYKQAVSDLLEMNDGDLSVLIRSQDFFTRIKDRVTNTYEAMAVNADWLEGALPLLY